MSLHFWNDSLDRLNTDVVTFVYEGQIVTFSCVEYISIASMIVKASTSHSDTTSTCYYGLDCKIRALHRNVHLRLAARCVSQGITFGWRLLHGLVAVALVIVPSYTLVIYAHSVDQPENGKDQTTRHLPSPDQNLYIATYLFTVMQASQTIGTEKLLPTSAISALQAQPI